MIKIGTLMDFENIEQGTLLVFTGFGGDGVCCVWSNLKFIIKISYPSEILAMISSGQSILVLEKISEGNSVNFDAVGLKIPCLKVLISETNIIGFITFEEGKFKSYHSFTKEEMVNEI